MSRYFKINLNSGTSPGPYTIYYDVVSNGNIATVMDTPILASGLTLQQLGFGLTVTVPDNASQIFLYNEYCQSSQTYLIEPKQTTYPCLCFRVEFLDPSYINEEYYLCPTGGITNGKPVYQSTTTLVRLVWNTAGYWEMQNHPYKYIFRSNDNDNIPDSSWYSVGLSTPQNTITVTQGQCLQNKPLDNLTITEIHPSCEGNSDGGLNVLAIGGVGGWSYSLNNIDYSNVTGIFTSLSGGTYTVYAKDSGGTITSKTIVLSGPPNSSFSVPASYTVTSLPTQGMMNYYMATLNYNTSQIPVGEFLTFTLRIVYNLSYTEPGSAIFNTATRYVTINGGQQSQSTANSTGFNVNGVSACSAIHNRYVGQDTYTYNLSLSTNDVFSVSVVWGIDTKTSGTTNAQCYTTAQVGVDIYFDNPNPSCNCCSFLGNSINITQPIQIYQP